MIVNPSKSSSKQQYPRLKAKAFETKVTLAAAKFVWQCESSPNDDQKHHWIQLCLDASCRMEDILKEHQHFYALPEPASKELVECLTNYQTILVALENAYWKQKGLKLFQSGTFKGHWLLHGVAESNHCNPLHLSCYSGESFMHTCKQLMQSCLIGRNALSSCRIFLQRYAKARSYEMLKHNSIWRLKWDLQKKNRAVSPPNWFLHISCICSCSWFPFFSVLISRFSQFSIFLISRFSQFTIFQISRFSFLHFQIFSCPHFPGFQFLSWFTSFLLSPFSWFPDFSFLHFQIFSFHIFPDSQIFPFLIFGHRFYYFIICSFSQ